MDFFIFIKKNIPIAWRIVSSIVLASVAISCIATVVLIYVNYNEEEENFNARVKEIQSAHMTSLANALWHFDSKQVAIQGEGLITCITLVMCASLVMRIPYLKRGRFQILHKMIIS
jgi:hypothetical protein